MEVERVVRSHDVKRVWSPERGKELTVTPEDNNDHDHHAIAMMKDNEVVGHVPSLSRLTCNMWFDYGNYHITCGGCGYYLRADAISLSKVNHANTIRGRVLFHIRVLLEEIRYILN